jgi:hypothetical protein
LEFIMFETTSETIARILARDADDRAGYGGTRRLVRSVSRAVPTGYVYPISNKPQLLHFVDFHYSDGTVDTYGSKHGSSLATLSLPLAA